MAKVEFEYNTPVTLHLRSIEGRQVDSQYGGEQRMFTAEEGVFWLSDEAGCLLTQRLRALGAQPGEPVSIVKLQVASANSKRKVTEWIPGKTTAGEPAVPSGRAGTTPRVPASKFADNLEEQLTASLEQAGLHKEMARAAAAVPQAAPETLPAWGSSLANQTATLIDVYARMLAYAGRHGNHIRPDDVRALMTTAFIGLSQRGGTTRAA